MSLPLVTPAQDSASSMLAIPQSDLQRPRAVNTSSSSPESSNNESGPNTPASSIHSSPASTCLSQTPRTAPPATPPHLSDAPPRPSYEEPQSSTPNSSSYAPSPNLTAQDAPDKASTGSMPTPSRFDPPSITLEPTASPEDSTAPHEENSATTGDVPSSVLEGITQYPETNTPVTWFSTMKNRILQRSWLQNTMGSTMLAATLIGLFIYQRRSYRIAIWAAENDYLQSCIGLAQLNQTLSARCKTVINVGVGEAPYTKRGFYSVGAGTYRLTKRIVGVMERGAGIKWNASRIDEWATSISASGVLTTMGGSSTGTSPTSTRSSDLFQLIPRNLTGLAAWHDDTQGTWTLLHLLFFISALVTQGFLLFWLVSSSRTHPVNTSPAHTEVTVTRYHREGPATTSSLGPQRFTRDYPRDNHPLGEIRRWLVSQEESRDSIEHDGYLSDLGSKNSSENTLVGSLTGSEISKVSISTGHDNKHHDGLLEFRSSDSTKHFLDPNTGEFIHLTPWKCPDGGDKDSTAKVKPKHGDISHVVAKLGAGSAAFTLKQIDEKTLEEKKKRSKWRNEVKEEWERKLAKEIKEIKKKKDLKDKSPLRAGDCVTGDITHEAPSGKPALVL
ncbi:hypothetical protein MMC22_006782 [Lobaria immixta]|nr:hypothetical protein [Lobaria immixta]